MVSNGLVGDGVNMRLEEEVRRRMRERLASVAVSMRKRTRVWFSTGSDVYGLAPLGNGKDLLANVAVSATGTNVSQSINGL